jgi:hypothetical protein
VAKKFEGKIEMIGELVFTGFDSAGTQYVRSSVSRLLADHLSPFSHQLEIQFEIAPKMGKN